MLDFQKERILKWLDNCFQSRHNDAEERMLRLLEEILELAQVEGISEYQIDGLIAQVYNKPVGVRKQELGGVLNTLAAYLACTDQDPNDAFETELTRCEQPETIKRIRKKHDSKLVVSSKLRG